jgi:flagellar transcriptional activator FlhC
MKNRSLIKDSQHLQRAVELIGLGARLQVLESETDLPHERLLKLYKEVAQKSPSKGQLPFSTDWFIGWQPNIHSSLFLNIYEYLHKTADIDSIDAITKAYRLYLQQVDCCNVEPMLSITRAWRLVRFVDSNMLCLTDCIRCGGKFVNHTYELNGRYICGLCAPPARAGKSKRRALIH